MNSPQVGVQPRGYHPDLAISQDERSVWHRLTFRERLRLLPPIHEIAVALHWTPIRDRLRCPSCKAVGTWKPHGSLVARWIYKDISVRRWLCKWCGYYTGPRGRVVAYLGEKVWELPEIDKERGRTPAEVVKAELGKVWPWHG